jgi:hypothetical protein
MGLGISVVTDKQRKEGIRWLILGTALSAVTAPALAAEFMLNSTEVKSGSPGFHRLQGAEHLAGAYLVGRAARHAKLRRDDLRS